MREALITWMQRRGWHDAAAACQRQCRSSGEASPSPGSSQPATAAPTAAMATGQPAEAMAVAAAVGVAPAVDRIAVKS